MPRLSATPISLTNDEDESLLRLSRAHKTPRKLAERASRLLAYGPLPCETLNYATLLRATPWQRPMEARRGECLFKIPTRGSW